MKQNTGRFMSNLIFKLQKENPTKEELVDMMLEIGIKNEAIEPWFNTPNKFFDNIKPQQLIDDGRNNLIRDLLFDMATGMPS